MSLVPSVGTHTLQYLICDFSTFTCRVRLTAVYKNLSVVREFKEKGNMQERSELEIRERGARTAQSHKSGISQYSLCNQMKRFVECIDLNFTANERFSPKRYSPFGSLTITLDEFYERVCGKDVRRKKFRVQYMVGEGMKRNERLLLGREGRAFLPVDNSCILGRAYNTNYTRRKTLDLFKRFKALYERRDVCSIIPDFDLDEWKTEKYLRGLSFVSRKERDVFFASCLRMEKSERSKSNI